MLKSCWVLVQSNSCWGPDSENKITKFQICHKKVDGDWQERLHIGYVSLYLSFFASE
jgi:hypothetical protein